MTKLKVGDMLFDNTARDIPNNEEFIVLLTKVDKPNKHGWEVWSSLERYDSFLFDHEIEAYYRKLKK